MTELQTESQMPRATLQPPICFGAQVTLKQWNPEWMLLPWNELKQGHKMWTNRWRKRAGLSSGPDGTNYPPSIAPDPGYRDPPRARRRMSTEESEGGPRSGNRIRRRTHAEPSVRVRTLVSASPSSTPLPIDLDQSIIRIAGKSTPRPVKSFQSYQDPRGWIFRIKNRNIIYMTGDFAGVKFEIEGKRESGYWSEVDGLLLDIPGDAVED